MFGAWRDASWSPACLSDAHARQLARERSWNTLVSDRWLALRVVAAPLGPAADEAPAHHAAPAPSPAPAPAPAPAPSASASASAPPLVRWPFEEASGRYTELERACVGCHQPGVARPKLPSSRFALGLGLG